MQMSTIFKSSLIYQSASQKKSYKELKKLKGKKKSARFLYIKRWVFEVLHEYAKFGALISTVSFFSSSIFFWYFFFFFKHDGVCCHIWVMQHWQKIEKTVGSSAAAYLTWTFLAIRENLITYVSHPTDPLTQLNSSVFFSVPSDSLLSSNCLRLMMAFYLRWLSCTWGKLCFSKT